MRIVTIESYEARGMRRAAACLVALCALLGAGSAHAQRAGADLCQCADAPEAALAFRSSDRATHPAGTVESTGRLTIPLPPGGRFVFGAFTVDGMPDAAGAATIRFQRNLANDPVTILVAGDALVSTGDMIDVSGDPGSTALNGSLGGPGGFRGGNRGDANVSCLSGWGFGPGGGKGYRIPLGDFPHGLAGSYVGDTAAPRLLGGSGGGGMPCSNAPRAYSGRGGGGAITIVANGEIRVDGEVHSRSGSVTPPGGGSGVGSGGAVRLVADTIAGSGRVDVGADGGNPGAVRFEAYLTSLSVVPGNARIVRQPFPGSLALRVSPRIAIRSVDGIEASNVNGLPLAESPEGWRAAIDVAVLDPSEIQVEVESQDVPGGSQVSIVARSLNGPVPLAEPPAFNGLLGDCSADGRCSATVMLALDPGRWFLEASATGRVP